MYTLKSVQGLNRPYTYTILKDLSNRSANQSQILYGVKSMQRSGTESIRTQIQPSQPKREITNITKPKTGNRELQQNYRLGTVSNGGLKLMCKI